MKTFRHSGDIGDIIYGLPAIRASGGGELRMSKRIDTRLTEAGVRSFIPLAEAQPYIAKAEWSNQNADCDMDEWRKQYFNHMTLADMQLRIFGLPCSERNCPWISVEPRPLFRVLCHRSPRYHNDKFPWAKVISTYGPQMAFVGMQEEHDSFTKAFGHIPYLPTKDYLELARAIAGCELFIGNQSSPFAVAESLKKRTVLEVCTATPNCTFDRPGALHVIDGTVILPELL